MLKDPALALELVMAMEGVTLDPRAIEDLANETRKPGGRTSRKKRKRRK